MERIVVNRSATLSRTFTAAPSGTPSVVVTRSDGSTVTTGSVSGASTDWAYTIPSTSNTQLDTYTETWTATIAGTPQVFVDSVEVAGGSLFELSEFRALGSGYANVSNYPDATVADMRTTVEQALEEACGVAFVPRFSVERVDGTGTDTVRLRWAYANTVRSLAIDGVVGTPADVAVNAYGIATYPAGFTGGTGNVTIGYEHGYGTPPARIKRAALLLAKRWITPGAADDRAINVTNETGTYALFQAGVRGHSFDIPEVEAAVTAYDMSVGVV